VGGAVVCPSERSHQKMARSEAA